MGRVDIDCMSSLLMCILQIFLLCVVRCALSVPSIPCLHFSVQAALYVRMICEALKDALRGFNVTHLISSAAFPPPPPQKKKNSTDHTVHSDCYSLAFGANSSCLKALNPSTRSSLKSSQSSNPTLTLSSCLSTVWSLIALHSIKLSTPPKLVAC